MTTRNFQADAVFEGNGVKGIGLVGAVAVAEEQGYRWSNLAGTSAGAIVAALLAAGYTGGELKPIIGSLDYIKFKDTGPVGRVPWIGPMISLITEKGMYEGSYFSGWMRELLKAKKVETFKDLIINEYRDEYKYRFKLRVIASDISNGRMLVLPQDIAEYGIKPQELEVADAVRMSMSIPFFYKPVAIKKGKSKDSFNTTVSYVVDGGVLSNFPVWLFDTQGSVPEWPTFGFTLVEPEEGTPHKVSGPISMLTSLFSTMMESHDARYIKEEHFARTIPIPTLGVKTTEFNITRERSEALYQSGRQAAEKFFSTWNFSQYIDKYRKGKPEIHRSDTV